ncbi:putative F-box domain-containing protein [Helianthus annuus]|nr:putative F-box domain-containing protein [Helianthus annuus]
MVQLPFHLILFQILIKIDTKSIHRFKLVSKQWRDGLSFPEFAFKRRCYVEDYLEMLQDQGLFITSSVLMELWPRELIELYGLHDQQASQKNLNVIEEMVVIENGERTVYQVYDDDN